MSGIEIECDSDPTSTTALDWRAQTPVLGARVSRVLESNVIGDDYLPSRINWVVQSSAVDYLHLLLVAADHHMDEMGIKERRFVISIHDEVRYNYNWKSFFIRCTAVGLPFLFSTRYCKHFVGPQSKANM